MSESHKGYLHTSEAKEKMAINRKGKGLGNIPWNKGIPHSEEANKKNSLSHMGKTMSDETKKKLSNSIKGQMNLNNG